MFLALRADHGAHNFATILAIGKILKNVEETKSVIMRSVHHRFLTQMSLL